MTTYLSFALKPTNAFAEFANKQIKRAYKTGNGYKHAVLRIKVIHGGVLVSRRPTHPLDRQWTRSKRDRAQRRAVRERAANPKANIALLEQALAEQDKTRNLLPKPQASLGWVQRFPAAPRHKPRAGGNELYSEEVKELKPSAGRGRRPLRHSSDQLKMF